MVERTAPSPKVEQRQKLARMEQRERLAWQAVDELKGAIRPLLDAASFAEHVEIRQAFNHAAVLAGRRLDIIQGRDLLTPSGGGGTEAHRIERRMVVDLDKRRVAILAKLIGMLSIMAGEGPEIIGYDPAQLHAEASMAIGIEDQDDIDGMAADIVEHGPDAHLLTERLDRIALTPSGDAEGRARELLGQAVWPMMDEAEAKAWLEKRMPGGPGGQVGIDYALRAITAALTPAPQPLREADWQPIETAPAATECLDRRVLVIGGIHKEAAIVLADGGWWRTRAGQGSNGVPTHWMPLPVPPIAQALAMLGDAK